MLIEYVCLLDRRGTELSLVIRQTMEAAILTNLLPRSQVLHSADASDLVSVFYACIVPL